MNARKHGLSAARSAAFTTDEQDVLARLTETLDVEDPVRAAAAFLEHEHADAIARRILAEAFSHQGCSEAGQGSVVAQCACVAKAVEQLWRLQRYQTPRFTAFLKASRGDPSSA